MIRRKEKVKEDEEGEVTVVKIEREKNSIKGCKIKSTCF